MDIKRRNFIYSIPLTIIAAKSGVAFSGENIISDNPLMPGDNLITYTDIPLWVGIPPGGGGPSGPVEVSDKGSFTNIAKPFLRMLKAKHHNGKSVLIAAGGGYKQINYISESLPAAEWLINQGYNAYILIYRLPGEGWLDGSVVALQDAQRALRLIRSIENHVSVLGFSAGGHLMGMAVTRSDFQSYNRTDDIDKNPARADKAGLIYPIITLEKPYTYTSTHKILVGPNASNSVNAEWSVQNYVTSQTPAIFLVQAEDDPISNPENSLIMASACKNKHVPVSMNMFFSGGHGFGMGRKGTSTINWPLFYKVWLDCEDEKFRNEFPDSPGVSPPL